jgi:hypothetical protein
MNSGTGTGASAIRRESSPPGGPDPAGRRVTGTVRHTDGSAIAGLLVQAFHRRVGGETPVGVETLTDERGSYTIGYQLPPGVSAVDLFVRGYAEQAVVAVSAIAVAAGDQETLDLTVADPKLRGPSQFAVASAALSPLVAGADADALDADDVALLVRGTGIGRDSVTAWIAAGRLAARTGVDHESLYGLVRTQNTASLPRLLRRSASRLGQALAGAADANLVSLAAGAHADATVARLRRLAVRLSTAPDTPSSLGRLLATATVATPTQRAGFIARYADHDGPVQGLWRALRDDPGFGDAVVDDLQLSLRLGTLSANHPPLVQALRDSGISHGAQTATLDTDAWRRLLHTRIGGRPVGTPPNIKGSTDAEREANYIALLRERSALAYPTAHVSQALRALPDWRSSTALAFLDLNPDFDLPASNLATGLDRPGVTLPPDTDRAQLQTELATVQRVARVSPPGKEQTVVGTLLAAGYASALAISRHSRGTFRRRTAGALGAPDIADTVHRNARFQVARAIGGYTTMHPSLGGGLVDAIGTFSPAVTTDPTWSSLFGNVDYCACPDCRSIHGPAAYLVDLLNWLDGHDASDGTAFDRLNARRPDLQRIELSCENTNTVLPYVDLTTEILEARVLDPAGAGGSLVPAVTTATSPELLANPEYLNPAAYDHHLAVAVYPDMLPFDLWGELGRVYFAHLGVRRSDLMETLRRAGTPDVDAIAAERLGLSTAQWFILAGLDPHATAEYWGYPDGQPFTHDLRVVSTFLDRAGIEYEDLLDLLHSRFVNPHGAVAVDGSDCDTDAMTVTPLPDGFLGRATRFLRLWRNRGWTMLDLDKALSALGIAELHPAGLRRLADLDRVLVATGAPLLDVLSWWAPIDTFLDRPEKDEPVPSRYDRTYLNRAVDAQAGEPDFPLALTPGRDALAIEVSWDEIRTILQAALSVDADDLALLIDETIDGLPNDQRVVTGTIADLAGLSALYRHVSLARALRLSVTDLLTLLRLVGIDPFDATRTDDTVAFVEAAADVDAGPFILLELAYLLEHDAGAETAVGVTDGAIGQCLAAMRDGLTRVAADYPVVADPTGEITGRYLSVVLTADAVAAVMTALGTEADATNHADLEAVLTDQLGALFPIDAAAVIALDVPLRFTGLVARLSPYLQETQGNAVIVEQVAGFLGRALDSTQDLLAARLSMTVDGTAMPALDGLRVSPYTKDTAPEIAAVTDPEAFAALRRLSKCALVLGRLDLQTDGQAWLFDVGVHNGLLDPLALPITPTAAVPGSWDPWTRLVDVAALETDLPGGEPTLIELLLLLESGGSEDTFRAELTARTGWLGEDLDYLLGAFAPAFPAGWRDGRTLRALVDAFALIGRLGVPAAQADRWATGGIDATQADALRLAAKSKHDEDRWPAIARALRDPVRDLQRAALVGYLVGRDDRYADADALFEDLLIDVQMAPCMLTSRIKQAISTVQLFIQRAFLNLEDGVELTREDRDDWEWMKNYRVWEAARKVFLYPENWIEPELRPDKSPLFAELENALAQSDLDDAAAERAYTAYLEGLAKIARAEVMGVYHQYESDVDGTVDVLHVVARTRAQPHEYHYRQWVDAQAWTAWEKLDVDIDADHVVLAVHDRRLFLFWPVVAQQSGATAGDADSRPVQSDSVQVKLSWVERMNGQWGGRSLSTGFITLEDRTWTDTEPSIYFRLGDTDELTVDCLHRHGDLTDLLGTFTVDPVTGGVDATSTTRDRPDVLPQHAIVDRMRLAPIGSIVASTGGGSRATLAVTIESASYDADGNLLSTPEEIQLLTLTNAGGVDYLYPHQYPEFASQHGVFLDDSQRTFHVMPQPAMDLRDLGGIDTVEPGEVATTAASSSAIKPVAPEPAFEPALPWDKLQESPILAERNGATSIAHPARGSGAVENTTADPAALAATLNVSSLQHSQVQLHEAGLSFDSMTIAQTNRYRFTLFYHPYVCEFMTELRRLGVAGLLDPDPAGSAPSLVRQQSSLDFFAGYSPTPDVLDSYPVQDIDFTYGGAYSTYNWELFFHAPLLIAGALTRNQRFEEARRWFHFMFDPTNDSPDADPLRFWKIKPFYRDPDAPIEDFLALAAGDDGTPAAQAARDAYDQQVAAWTADPFNPHAIAQLRTTAYQKTLVMKYLDNLIGWGDQLFRQDTIESINEATQLYVLALHLLGERPDEIPPRAVPAVTTFEQVRAGLADSILTNPLVRLENLTAGTRLDLGRPDLTGTVTSWGDLLIPLPPLVVPQVPDGVPAFYFAIPPNEKLLSYWDTVADRLFKIRNCMNIEGVVRALPLFEPPIDPGMLVRARAAGVDLASALADLSAPLPYYRFTAMLQKAYALNQTVRGLGAALLAALERADADALELLRADQEVALLEAVRQVKTLAVDEAQASLDAAVRGLDVVAGRRDYYQGLVSAGLLAEEKMQQSNLDLAGVLQMGAADAALIGSALTPIPAIVTGASGTMGTPVATAEVTSGQRIAKMFELVSQAAQLNAGVLTSTATVLGLTAGFSRREQEWTNQVALADLEIDQVGRQIDAARIRVDLAQRDLAAHDLQTGNARSVQDFMRQRFTNAELRQWTVGQLSSLYFQSYQLAYDLAKRAERGYRHELALPDATFVQFGYWDSLRKGLLAGERLQYDLERMDASYLDRNQREYEITRHVSLALLDPVALTALQTGGSCQFSIPESLFDLDYPGQYLRRLRSVTVTVPCVTGPYTAVPMRLSLVASRTRVDPTATGNDYPMDLTADDPRFQVQTGAVQSIVVSGGIDDAGVFTADARDERYLPFEGSGAISDWSLTLTSAVPTFDPTTITDVVLCLRYTAREGGDPLRDAALAALNAEFTAVPPRRAFSARSEFPAEWNAFLRPADAGPTATLAVDLTEQLFPYLARGGGLRITNLELVAVVRDPAQWPGADVTVATGGGTQTATLVGSSGYGGAPSASVAYPSSAGPGRWEITVPTDRLGVPADWADDVILIATYAVHLAVR